MKEVDARSRVFSLIALISVWAVAAALQQVRFSSIGSGTIAPPAADGAEKTLRGVSLAVGIAMVLGSSVMVGLLVLLVLGSRRRKKDDQAEAEREPPRLPWYGYLALALGTIALVLAVLWGLVELVRYSGFLEGGGAARMEAVKAAEAPTVKNPAAAGMVPALRGAAIPKWLLFSVFGACLIGIAILFGYALFTRKSQNGTLAVDIERIAEAAEERLAQGADLADSVIACYRDMCAALADRLKLRGDMTVREFADRLSQTGFPVNHVMTLTGLFERVRYGHEELGKLDRARARETLGAIKIQARGCA